MKLATLDGPNRYFKPRLWLANTKLNHFCYQMPCPSARTKYFLSRTKPKLSRTKYFCPEKKFCPRLKSPFLIFISPWKWLSWSKNGLLSCEQNCFVKQKHWSWCFSLRQKYLSRTKMILSWTNLFLSQTKFFLSEQKDKAIVILENHIVKVTAIFQLQVTYHNITRLTDKTAKI